MRTTIYDVAKKAGVSIATVSKVFNKKGNISTETIQHVLQVAKELNYKPSFVASALTGKSTNTIGLLIPDIANSFFSEMARSIEDRGHELGYTVVICNTDNLPEKEAQYLEWLQRKSVDGIILGTGATSINVMKTLQKDRIPTALVSREIPGFNVNMVLCDDFQGAFEATEHLLKLGHTNIGFITAAFDNLCEQTRLEGYKAALKKHKVPFKEANIFSGNMSIEQTKQNVKEQLSEISKMTAFFAVNDLVAIGLIQGLKEQGFSLPNDMSIVGFDNTMLAVINDPSLTTIAQPIQKMGQLITDLLIDEINGVQAKKEKIVMKPELIIRKSAIKYKPDLKWAEN